MTSTAVTTTPSDCTPDQTCVTEVQQSSSDASVQLLSPEHQSVSSHCQAHGSTRGGDFVGMKHSIHHFLSSKFIINHALVHSSVVMYLSRK